MINLNYKYTMPLFEKDEQKEAFDAGKLAYLQQRVDEYNSTVDDNKKLVLQ